MSYSLPGIYNVLDAPYSMSPAPNADGKLNAQGLQLAVTTAEANGGGIILIPSDDASGNGGVYNMEPQPGKSYAVSITGSAPLLFLGTGGATVLEMQKTSGDLFDTSGFTGTELAFQDLRVLYKQPPTGTLQGAAFNLTDCPNVVLSRLHVDDCETPIVLTNVQKASVRDITIEYTGSYPSTQISATCITIAGNSTGVSTQIDLVQCICRVDLANVPEQSIGLLVTGVNGLRVRGVYFADLSAAGIQIAPAAGMSCENMYFSQVISASPGYAALVQPQSGSPVSNLTFSDCEFRYDSMPGSPVAAYLNTGDNSLIDTVLFKNCSCVLGTTYGLQIAGGENISVIGGIYSSNGTAGIAITGAASGVLVKGATFAGPSYAKSSGSQQYGVSIASGATGVLVKGCSMTANSLAGMLMTGSGADIQVSGCDLTGNAQNGISVTNNCTSVYIASCNLTGYSSGSALQVSDPGGLQVINCPGYNDQGQSVSNQIPTSETLFNGVTLGAPTSYYGPVTFYVTKGTSHVTAIKISGTATGRTLGTFTLDPPIPSASGGPYAEIDWTKEGAAEPTFLMIGN